MPALDRSDAEGQIKLLLEEYRSLRDESKQRISERITLLGLLTAAGALIASSHNAVWAYAVGAGFLVVGGAVWLRSWRIIDKLGTRLARLEEGINKLASDAYSLGPESDRLRWETELQQHRADLRNAKGLVGVYGRIAHPHPSGNSLEDPGPTP